MRTSARNLSLPKVENLEDRSVPSQLGLDVHGLLAPVFGVAPIAAVTPAVAHNPLLNDLGGIGQGVEVVHESTPAASAPTAPADTIGSMLDTVNAALASEPQLLSNPAGLLPLRVDLPGVITPVAHQLGAVHQSENPSITISLPTPSDVQPLVSDVQVIAESSPIVPGSTPASEPPVRSNTTQHEKISADVPAASGDLRGTPAVTSNTTFLSVAPIDQAAGRTVQPVETFAKAERFSATPSILDISSAVPVERMQARAEQPAGTFVTSGSEREPSPESLFDLPMPMQQADLHETALQPDGSSLSAAVGQFLAQLDDVGRELSRAVARHGWLSFAVGAGVAGTLALELAYGHVRRRLPQEETGEAFQWIPGLGTDEA